MSALQKKGGQNNYNIGAFNKINMLLWITRIPGGKKQVVKKGLLYSIFILLENFFFSTEHCMLSRHLLKTSG